MMPSTTTGDLEKISILVRCFLILIRLKVVQDVITRHPVEVLNKAFAKNTEVIFFFEKAMEINA